MNDRMPGSVTGQSYRDQWADWILHRRHGGADDELRATLVRLANIQERVLDNAEVATGQTLLDVGTGDGLIAFGSLERVGQQGQVIFSDVSLDLLDHSRNLAQQMGVVDQCRFVRALAEDLTPIADSSADVVTTRSVLAYVAAKQQALEEFFRVLRPGGRISLYEPVNRLIYAEPPHRFEGYDVTPVQDLAEKVNAVLNARQPPDADPMFNFDERDLLAFVDQAGFAERHLELRVDVRPQTPARWEVFAQSAPNPVTPTLEEAMTEALSPIEAQQFAAHLKPLVERGEGTFATAVAYVWAKK